MSSVLTSRAGTPRLLVDIIEQKSQSIGEQTFLRYPGRDWRKDGYRVITWKQYASAVDKIAYWLDEQLGQAANGDTVAFLGPADPRYAIAVPAAMKTNRKLLIPDGRLTPEGLQGLVDATHCKAWVQAQGDRDIQSQEPQTTLKKCIFPSLDWCLNSDEQRPYPYTKTFEEAKNDEILIIHTSGTTGIPRPIYHTNGYYSAWANMQSLSNAQWPQGITSDIWKEKVMLTSCPPQWLGGLLTYMFMPVFLDTTAVIPPPDVVGLPPSIFPHILEFNKVDGIFCPPQTIQELYNEPKTRPLLQSLDYIVYVGAALDRTIGDDLCRHTNLTSAIGSTETGQQCDLQPMDKMLWYSHEYVPGNGHRMVRVPGSGNGSEDLYELVLNRSPDGNPNLFQSAFWNPMYQGMNAIETKEMYAPIKDTDGRTRWELVARKDDLTKLDWLAKFHASDIEAIIKRHPGVYDVFVGGEGRPTPYVIVELREGVLRHQTESKFLDELYDGVVTKSNRGVIAEIKIPRQTIFVAWKPFKRNFKGLIIRREVEKDFIAEIDETYKRLALASN